MGVLRFLALFAQLFYLFFSQVAEAQYLQDYIKDTTTTGKYTLSVTPFPFAPHNLLYRQGKAACSNPLSYWLGSYHSSC